MANRRMALSVHWDGQLVVDENGPKYVGGRKKLIAIRFDSTYTSFETRMYRLTNCTREEFRLKFTIRCPAVGNEYLAHEIIDDDSFEGMIGLFENFYCGVVSVYIEKELHPSENFESQGYYTRMLHNYIDGDVRMTRESEYSSIESIASCSVSSVPPTTTCVPATTTHTQATTSRGQCTTSRLEPRISHLQLEPYDSRLSTSYEHWNNSAINEFVTNVDGGCDNIDEGGDNIDGGGVSDINHEDAPINDDHYSNENDDLNDPSPDIDDDHDGGLNSLANTIFNEIDNPQISNEYVDNPDEEIESVDHPEHFPSNNNWINQYVVDPIKFDIRQTNIGSPSIDGTWVGRIFHDKASLLDALDRWHIDHNVQKKVLKSSKTTYTVKCTIEGCPWRLHASVPKDTAYFRIKTYAGPHTCVISMLNAAHQFEPYGRGRGRGRGHGRRAS